MKDMPRSFFCPFIDVRVAQVTNTFVPCLAIMLVVIGVITSPSPAHASQGGDWRYPMDILRDLVDHQLLLDSYQTSYAIGDFNADGHNDLAVGVPYATVLGKRAAGRIVLVEWIGRSYPKRLTTFHQAAVGRLRLPGANESGDLVGYSLAVGDFNGDGVDDLAVGAPGEDRPGAVDAGAVFIGHGIGGVGLDFRRPGMAYTQDGLSPFDLAGSARAFNWIGFSLAAGNFDGDAYGDLAIGLPGYGSGSDRDAEGAVAVASGTGIGLHGQAPHQPYHQALFRQGGSGNYNLAGSAEHGDLVGFSLSAGDFDGNGKDDLAIGAPGENVSADGREQDNAGMVVAVEGTRNGLDARLYPDPLLPNSTGRARLRGRVEREAYLGFALATGDFEGDGRDDLAIGVPGQAGGVGTVAVARGMNTAGIGLNGQSYSMEFAPFASDDRYDLPGAGGAFGCALAAGDFDANGRDDLAIGTPDTYIEQYNHLWINTNYGSVYVRFGSATGGLASAITPRLYHRSQPEARDDLEDVRDYDDYLGRNLAAGRLNADQAAELVISVPEDRVIHRRANGSIEMEPFSETTVDGMTHVIDGVVGEGPDAGREDHFWFSRYNRGCQIAPHYVFTAAEDWIPGIDGYSPDRRNIWLMPTGEDDYHQNDYYPSDGTLGSLQGIHRWTTRFECWTRWINSEAIRYIVAITIDAHDGQWTRYETPVATLPSGSPRPKKLILLPTGALEIIFEEATYP